MSQSRHTAALEPARDPFGEQTPMAWHLRLQLLGGRFQFTGESQPLLRLLEHVYGGLPAPRRRLLAAAPAFRIMLRSSSQGRAQRSARRPRLTTLSGPAALLCAVMDAGNFSVVSPAERSGLVVLSPHQLSSSARACHQLLEFAVFSLAARAQGLLPLHAACVGRAGRGLLLMGSSGAGKSTVALHCLLQGLEFLSEDAVLVRPEQLLATGASNFLHLRRDSLRLLDDQALLALVRKSPLTQHYSGARNSGTQKFELNLRPLGRRLAGSPLAIDGIVFLSDRKAGACATVLPLPARELLARLAAAQPHATQLPAWRTFRQQLEGVQGFELRRGTHPAESAVALRHILELGRQKNFALGPGRED
jgi:hypothetical protein